MTQTTRPSETTAVAGTAVAPPRAARLGRDRRSRPSPAAAPTPTAAEAAAARRRAAWAASASQSRRAATAAAIKTRASAVADARPLPGAPAPAPAHTHTRTRTRAERPTVTRLAVVPTRQRAVAAAVAVTAVSAVPVVPVVPVVAAVAAETARAVDAARQPLVSPTLSQAAVTSHDLTPATPNARSTHATDTHPPTMPSHDDDDDDGQVHTERLAHGEDRRGSVESVDNSQSPTSTTATPPYDSADIRLSPQEYEARVKAICDAHDDPENQVATLKDMLVTAWMKSDTFEELCVDAIALLDRTNEQMAAVLSEEQYLRRANDEMQADVVEMTSAMARLERALSACKADRDALENDNARLTKMLSTSTCEHPSSSPDADRVASTQMNQPSAVETNKDEVAARKKRLREYDDRLTWVILEYELQRDERTRLASECAQQREQLDGLRHAKRVLEHKLETVGQEHEAICASFDSRLADARDSLTQTQARVRELETEVAHKSAVERELGTPMAARNNELEADILTLTKLVARQADEMTSLNTEREWYVSEFERVRARSQREKVVRKHGHAEFETREFEMREFDATTAPTVPFTLRPSYFDGGTECKIVPHHHHHHHHEFTSSR